MDNELSVSNNANFNLEWSIFHAALRSYKSEIYIDKEIIEFATKEMLERLWVQIANCQLKGLTLADDIQRFHNTVMKKQKFRLSICLIPEMNEILENFLINNKNSKNFDFAKMMLFKVNYETSGTSENFNRFSEKYGTFQALHGSPVNRFYSILQHGLHLPNTNEEPGLYGFGIYLTNKLDVALHFAQAHLFDCGWLKDESIKIVALCQVAKHPTAVVRKEHQSSDGFTFDSGIPPEYYLVKDESMVHVTHILVEPSCPISSLQAQSRLEPIAGGSPTNLIDTFTGAFRRNWLLYTVCIYIGVLFLVACFKGRSVLFSDWDSSDLLSIND